MSSEPDCLAGLLIALFVITLGIVLVIVCNPTPEQQQLIFNMLGRDATGIIWTRLVQ